MTITLPSCHIGDRRSIGIHPPKLLVGVVCAALIAMSGSASATAQPSVPNPPWPSRCPLRLALVVDQSSSMSARFDDVRDAARNVVDSLRDKRSEVTIVGFGTTAEVIRSAVDVSEDDARHQLKDRIGELTAHGGDDSATNWEAALTVAGNARFDVVILVTDGLPTAYGDPVREGDQEAVDAAVAAADRLKAGGARLVAVGIELRPEGERNLRIITGPTRGEDYYVTDTAGLLRQLYGIVASSCGVPITQLPQPESPEFPWLETILGTLGGLVLIGLAAIALHRKRSGREQYPARDRRAPVAGPNIDHSHLVKQLRADDRNRPTTKDTL
ncbi:MAG TPA: vWA domain-containing protein [Actinophytocola sp.]|uniref:vWA domain-containing protein n=1 Tax=Actinophytocola sp. TaxID=1872138 RepID=UPI002DB61F48|nr:vWA domain-containing protein [Actinophytocola sp.]HEU5474856.1 vWA domain-containing protein [Actinophytocola sp.]